MDRTRPAITDHRVLAAVAAAVGVDAIVRMIGGA
jgi:hypothetical protein